MHTNAQTAFPDEGRDDRDTEYDSLLGVTGVVEAAAWTRHDAMKLYRALFEAIPDALILADSECNILAVNQQAVSLFCEEETDLLGRDCRRVFGPEEAAFMADVLVNLEDDTLWQGVSTIATPADGEVPVDLSVHKVCVAGDSLLQIVIRDMSVRVGLEQDLQRTEAVVEGMNLALRHVIKSVHEERREMKDELVQQVKEQVMPTLERIADEDSSDMRQSYKSVIEDQLVDMADGASSDPLEGIMLRLTPREVEICRLIALGRKTREICDLLQLSFETLQTHRKNIRRKLDLTGQRVSLYVYLQQQSSLPRT